MVSSFLSPRYYKLKQYTPVHSWLKSSTPRIYGIRMSTHYSRHCDKATTEPVQGEIRGTIPSWLEGTLIRNGPGIQKIGEDQYAHIFDGLAILHRYEIKNGVATYTSRPLESDTYLKNMAANRIVVGEFGTTSFRDPCKSLFERLQSTFNLFRGKSETTDNCSVNVGYVGDQLYAMTETNLVRRVDPSDLKTIGRKTNLTKYATVNHATAHPHILSDGSMLNLGSTYQNKQGPRYCVFQVPPTFGQEETAMTNAKVVAEIPFTWSRKPSYYHSFGMTKDKIIFIESPLRLDLFHLMTASLRQRPFSSSLGWDPSLKTRIHIASMKDGELHPVIYEADPFFTFHHINAFEEDEQIVVDVAAYSDGSFVTDLRHDKSEEELRRLVQSNARRFVLPLKVPQGAADKENLVKLKDCKAKAVLASTTKSGEATVHLEPEHLSNELIELPRINYSYNGTKYNFFYGISSTRKETWDTLEPDSITKTNILSKEVMRWSEEGKHPSEPIFVANPNGKSEDDGVLLTALSHKDELNAVTLLVLNAANMTEIARVDFEIAGAFTTTFHGQWAGQNEKVHLY